MPGQGQGQALTSVKRGSRVTLCIGRIRKEIMGRPPHAGRCSIARRASRKVALLLLQQRTGSQLRRVAWLVQKQESEGSCRSWAASSEARGLLLPRPPPTLRARGRLTSAAAGHAAGRPRWSSRRCRGGSDAPRAPPGCR